MNRKEAQRLVYLATARSLRKMADTPWRLFPELRGKPEMKKLSKEMLALAQRLSPSEMQTYEVEAGPSGPDEGKDNIPQDGDAAAKGDTPAAAGEHEPQAR